MPLSRGPEEMLEDAVGKYDSIPGLYDFTHAHTHIHTYCTITILKTTITKNSTTKKQSFFARQRSNSSKSTFKGGTKREMVVMSHLIVILTRLCHTEYSWDKCLLCFSPPLLESVSFINESFEKQCVICIIMLFLWANRETAFNSHLWLSEPMNDRHHKLLLYWEHNKLSTHT